MVSIHRIVVSRIVMEQDQPPNPGRVGDVRRRPPCRKWPQPNPAWYSSSVKLAS